MKYCDKENKEKENGLKEYIITMTWGRYNDNETDEKNLISNFFFQL